MLKSELEYRLNVRSRPSLITHTNKTSLTDFGLFYQNDLYCTNYFILIRHTIRCRLYSFFGPLIVLKRTLGGTANGALKSLRLSGIIWPHTLNLRSVSPIKVKKSGHRR